jgi:hypothetical protein
VVRFVPELPPLAAAAIDMVRGTISSPTRRSSASASRRKGENLVEQASKNPIALITLLGKVLPLQVSGEDGGAVIIKFVSVATMVPVPRIRARLRTARP